MQILGYEISFKRAEKRTDGFNGQSYLALNSSFAPAYGVKATDKTVLGLSPVWSAIRYISEGVAGLPYGIYRETPTGNEPYKSHPLNYLLCDRPHPHYSKFDFFAALIANACMGDGFARIHFDMSTGRPYALELLPRHIVSMRYTPDGRILYDVMGNPAPSEVFSAQTIVATLQEWEMIHIKGVSFNGLKGERLTLTHRDGFGAAIAAQQYTKNFFDNGAAVSGAMVFPQALTKEQLDRAESKFREKYAGSDNAGRVMILDAGMKFERFSMGPQEAALVDFRNLSAEDTSRIFKIPLHMLSSLDRSTYSNIEQQENDYYAHTLPPWTLKVEQEINYKLFTRIEREKRRAFTGFDYTFARMGDSESTAKMIAATIQNGVMEPNEWRQRMNLQTKPDGDRRYIQQNMMPVDLADDVLMNKYAKPATNTAAPEPEDVEDDDEMPDTSNTENETENE